MESLGAWPGDKILLLCPSRYCSLLIAKTKKEIEGYPMNFLMDGR
jgi:hypothetical protein